MKILHICETIVGGVASHLEEMIALQRVEFGSDNVHLLAPRTQDAQLGGLAGTNIHMFGDGTRSLSSVRTLRAAAARLIRDIGPDIVHLHSSFAGALVRTLPLGARRPVIVYCPHGWAFAMETSGWKKLAYATVERALALRTDAIINVSEHERQLAIAYRLPKPLLFAVINGITTRDDAVIPHTGFRADRINIVFVGRLDRQKGVDILLREAALLTDTPFHFHIVGDAVRAENREWLTSDLPNVSFLGWQPRANVLGLMAAADGVVAPSRWEGLSIAALEAMKAGRALIASNRCSFPEIIEDGKTGYLFEIDTPGDLARVLRATSREDLHRLGRNARELFLQRFTAERQAGELSRLYEACLERRAG